MCWSRVVIARGARPWGRADYLHAAGVQIAGPAVEKTLVQEDPVMAPSSTFLAPGQRYAPPDSPTWRVEPQVVVLKVHRSPDGADRIAYRCRMGEVVVTLAEELEELVEAGKLVPIAAVGRLASN
jgi:hypothetical protein